MLVLLPAQTRLFLNAPLASEGQTVEATIAVALVSVASD